jgi:hypothetical protein
MPANLQWRVRVEYDDGYLLQDLLILVGATGATSGTTT